MRFFLDHDVPDHVTELLRQLGHSVTRLREVLSTETSDPEVLDYAIQQEMILITCNRDDFLTLAAGKAHPGIIILIRRDSRSRESSRLVRMLEQVGESGLSGNINFA